MCILQILYHGATVLGCYGVGSKPPNQKYILLELKNYSAPPFSIVVCP